MHKRQFLSTSALGGLRGLRGLGGLSGWLGLAAGASGTAHAASRAGNGPGHGPGLLTVTGAIGKGNRGGLDPTLDQMMVKHKLRFDRAHVFAFSALAALPAVSIKPTLEYDAKPHTLRGPLLATVAQAAGAVLADGTQLLLRAVDGYAVGLSLADARRYGYIVATHLDGVPMALGGLGPLWAVYEADRFADMAAKPLADRFALCPWGLYHLEIKTG